MGRLLLVMLVALAVLAPSAQAAADHTAPPGNSGVDQYFEAVPSASGNQRPGSGTKSAPLPKRVQESLAAQGSDGEAVLQLAEASAPAAAREGGASKSGTSSGTTSAAGPKSSGATPGADAPASVISSTAQAIQVGGSGGGMGTLLPVLLILTAAGAIAFTLLRRRASGR